MKNQRILIIDNYDSFTFNLLHYIEEVSGLNCTVIRNDEVTADLVQDFDSLLLSPGPGMPEEANMLIPVVKQFIHLKKILGVCLGHQALTVATGGQLLQLNTVMHGLQRNCHITNAADPILRDVPPTFEAGRYHSWVIDKKTLAQDWVVSSEDEEGNIMSMFHHKLPVFGVQFHPESIMTPVGKTLLKNWLEI